MTDDAFPDAAEEAVPGETIAMLAAHIHDSIPPAERDRLRDHLAPSRDHFPYSTWPPREDVADVVTRGRSLIAERGGAPEPNPVGGVVYRFDRPDADSSSFT